MKPLFPAGAAVVLLTTTASVARAQDPYAGLNQLSREQRIQEASITERLIPFTIEQPAKVTIRIKFTGNFSIIPHSRLTITRKGTNRTWQMQFPGNSMIFDKVFPSILPGSYELRIVMPQCNTLPGGCSIQRAPLKFETSLVAEPIPGLTHISIAHKAPDKLAPMVIRNANGRTTIDGGVDMFENQMWFSFRITKPTRLEIPIPIYPLEIRIAPVTNSPPQAKEPSGVSPAKKGEISITNRGPKTPTNGAKKTYFFTPGQYLLEVTSKPTVPIKSLPPDGYPFSIPLEFSPMPIQVDLTIPHRAEIGNFVKGEFVVTNMLSQTAQDIQLQFEATGLNFFLWREPQSDVDTEFDLPQNSLKLKIDKLQPNESKRLRFLFLAHALSDDAFRLRTVTAEKPPQAKNWVPPGMTLEMSAFKMEIVPNRNPEPEKSSDLLNQFGYECAESSRGLAMDFFSCLKKNGWSGQVP